ncbi:MAG: hypothetical protein ABR987_17400 [Terracidiphilus sp.]|jgi:hypothetical protein
MKRIRLAAMMASATLLVVATASAQSDDGSGHAVVTIFAKHNEVAPNVAQQDVSAKVNGKDAAITGWAPFKGPNDGMELIVLIDAGARNLGRQFDEIKQFVQSLNPDTKVAIGYMQNGYASMAGPLSTDHKQTLNELHLPAGPNTNPYFTLSDLSHRWPSQDRKVRREVVMLSDGVDPENRRFDPEDPYVESAIRDCVQAGMVVYTIYWRSGPDGGEGSFSAEGGQSHLNALSQATGGYSYWSGEGNPVSFQPFFDDLQRRFENQYALDFAAHVDRKPEVETLKLKVEGLGLQVTAPQQVFVRPGGSE